jgi:hypothetical protein
MNYQPIETKNYRKPKITKRPVAMLVIGIVIGVALAARKKTRKRKRPTRKNRTKRRRKRKSPVKILIARRATENAA